MRRRPAAYVDQQDRLTIRCNLEVLEEEEDSTLADDIHSLFSLSSESSDSDPAESSPSEKRRRAAMMPDVTFVVEQTEIHAHRLVLAMRSPVFAAELLGNMRERTMSRLEIDDMRASTFRAMLRFIYTDKLPIKGKNSNDHPSQRSAWKEKSATRRRVAMACDLLMAADRYEIGRASCRERVYVLV